MLGISVVADAQGRGLGSALMAAMCDYSDRWVGALRLELTVTDSTHAMVRFHPQPPAIIAAAIA